MKKHFYILALLGMINLPALHAAVGDTTWVQAFYGDFTHYGAFDTGVVFPDGSVTYRKIYMIITIGEYSCVQGSQYCHQWDYDLENYVMTPAGDTLELGRFITPYATTGTPGFTGTWQQHYIYDVSDYYPILQNSALMRVFYSGYSWGFTGDVKFAFIQGTPERNVLGHAKLWNNTYTYGDTANPIDSNLLQYTLIPPAGTVSTEMKFLISGHGADNTSQCCEFDNTGVGHPYTVWANNNPVAEYNMNVNCGLSELYPQGGTWLYQRAGNWCPGGSVNVAQYPLPGIIAGMPFTTDVSFDDSYNGGGNYGIYKIASVIFYYAGYNKTLDASMEDVIAPTNFEWYRRENPRVSVPVVKVRNTGANTITSLLLQYGVKDSIMSEYIWTGSLRPSADTIISLPAISSLTNLSVDSALGTFGFVAMIKQVNGQTDADQSNDTITSQFTVAPKWPYTFVVRMTTSSIGANGNFGSNPADASWQITDANNNVVASRTNTNVTTTYSDTVTLNSSNFYALTVTTSQCYGLNWWALAGQPGYTAGSLAIRNYKHGNGLINLNGTANTGTYEDDFGCGFIQYFTTAGQCIAVVPVITKSHDTLIASPANSYQWYNNGSPIIGATNQDYTPGTDNGNYTVEITDGNGCTANSASIPFIIICDSISAIPTPTSCATSNDGEIAVIVANKDSANGPFTYTIIGDTTQADSIFTGLAPGLYTLVVHNNVGCSDTLSHPIAIISDSLITVRFIPDTFGYTAVNGDTIILNPLLNGFRNPLYQWSPNNGLSCTACPNPAVIITGPAVYYVRISDSLNPLCNVYDSVFIQPKGQFAMPNAFTPNGDGVDDEFGPVKFSFLTIKAFRIYNRWGQLMHNSNTYWDGKFDGKEQPAGAYVYYIEVQHPDEYDYGTTITEKKEGSVILIR